MPVGLSRSGERRMSQLIFTIVIGLLILFFYCKIYITKGKSEVFISVDELLVFIVVEFFTILWIFG